MRNKITGIILLAAIMAGVWSYGPITYAKEKEELVSEEEKTQESGKTFLEMIMEEPEEGSWEDVNELTPGILGDGIFKLEAEVKNGTGEGRIDSPVTMNISGGIAKILISWDSDRYAYMLVNGTEYQPLEKEDTSVFEMKLEILNQEPEVVVGGTDESGNSWKETYVLALNLDTIEKDGMNPRILGMILGVVIGVAVMFIIIKLDKLHDKKKAAKQNMPAVKNTNKYRK